MTDDDVQRAAGIRAKTMDGFARAERALFTRPAPKSVRAQMNFLRTREKGSTKTLAERLGVSRKLPLGCLYQAEPAPPGGAGAGGGGVGPYGFANLT